VPALLCKETDCCALIRHSLPGLAQPSAVITLSGDDRLSNLFHVTQPVSTESGFKPGPSGSKPPATGLAP
jgi:hypothetical protein